MRTLVLLLVLANLTFFAYTALDRVAGAEGSHLEEQVDPDKIKLLTPREVAALSPTKVAELADVCLEWGPFSDADRTRALAALEPLQLGRLLTQKRMEGAAASYWVIVPPAVNKAAADAKVAELRTQGIKDFYVVDSGPQRFAISLGVFRTEDAANTHLAELQKRGVLSARVAPRQQVAGQTMLVIRDPQQNVVTRVKELQPEFAQTEMKTGACDKSG